MAPNAALAELQTIRGVGPWSASHIYVRGVAPRDALPTIEPRVLRGWGLAADIDAPTEEAFVRAAEAWRPFRMWVAVLCARHLHRSGTWGAAGIAAERTRAIRSARSHGPRLATAR